ncbi:MAG: hypothetical protein HKN12_01945, partial [Gemmatimonadetes bacterium]|nr:hypothetical protein [Gemmatimonadota bacterium]
TLPSGTIAAVLLWGLLAGAIGGGVTARLTAPFRGSLIALLVVIGIFGSIAGFRTGYPHCWYKLALVGVQMTGAWLAGRRVLALRGAS